MDELILAHTIRSRSVNPWQSSADAIVLYGQNGKARMKNAFFVMLLYFVATLQFAMFLIPAGLMGWMLTGQPWSMTMIFALVCVWAAKAALRESLALACIMQACFKFIRGQQPDSVWDRAWPS